MKVLLTGGTGYIGSHIAVELLKENIDVIIVDNLSNSKKEVVFKIEKITNRKVIFYEGDIRNKEMLTEIFTKHKIEAVIHLAGYKGVGESVTLPIMYYNNNFCSTLTLLEVMNEFKCKRLVFSSSATVYKESDILPIKENFPLKTTNPYANTKLMIETILKDLYNSDKDWSISILRYFNPIGAHESNIIGEDSNNVPNNLMPYILKVASKEYKVLTVFGNDYDTYDGTCIRDYIHVVDLAIGHVKALNYANNNKGLEEINLGTGNGYSVLELVNIFERVNNIKIPYVIGKRRLGDIASYYADSSKAYMLLDFKCNKTIVAMCKDAYDYSKVIYDNKE